MGYRKTTENSTNAANLFMETEELYLDDTYAAKAVCAFLDYSKANSSMDSILFWHTSNCRTS